MISQRMRAVADFALSKVGCGYIYGATGWVCSKKRREEQANQYPTQANNILGIGAKWDGVVCFDCAQLTRFAVGAAGGHLPSGANSQWKTLSCWLERGSVSGGMPDEPGIILYRLNASGVAQHTGVYVGDGYTVDARGTEEGVVKRPLSSYGWTHWARPALALMDGGETVKWSVPCGAMVKTKSGKGIGLWTDNAKTVKVTAVPEGAVVDVLDAPDGKGFARAAYGGKEGLADAQYLYPLAEDGGGTTAPEDDYAGDGHIVTVSIPELERAAEELRKLLEDGNKRQETIRELQEAVNGWMGVWG